MNNPFTLTGKTVLVTGASSGIGREVAICSSASGANVIITGRNAERLEGTFHALHINSGQEHRMCVTDITEDAGIASLADAVGRLDGLVHSAGINDKALLKYIDREKIDKMFRINYSAPLLLTKELFRQKKLNGGCSLVFISSISSTYATISNALYASSKGAVNALIRVLALELSGKKIRVNGIMPGMVRTDMIKAYGLSDEQLQETERHYPLGRLGTPVDIANAALFYLSDASSWITGTNLTVDGGVTLR